MSCLLGVLFIISIEGILAFDLIPNNINYEKVFMDSFLPICIVLKDGNIKYRTQKYINPPYKLIEDIKAGEVKGEYSSASDKNVMYELMEMLDIHNNYLYEISNRCEERLGDSYILNLDNEAWLFDVSMDGQEITAVDIEEEYRLNKKVKEQNDLINKNNEELEWTIENIELLEKEENLLKLRNN